jgi:DNA-binding transcriptional regulator YhcF (GntR family)
VKPERAVDVARRLRNRLLWGLHIGSIRIGDRIPSARDLAAEFEVDVRTALRACRILDREGLIEMRRRSGMYVALQHSHAPSLTVLQTTLVDLLCDASARGVSPKALRELLTASFWRRHIRIACVEENADHGAAIAAMVTREYGVDAVPVSLAALNDGSAHRHLTDVIAAVTTCFLAASVRPVVEPIGLPVFVAMMKPLPENDVRQASSNRPIVVIGTDRRWADRSSEGLTDTDVGKHVRTFVIDEDDLSGVPPNADVFVTPAAAPRVASLPVPGRVRTIEFWLPPTEARGLLSTIVAEQAS